MSSGGNDTRRSHVDSEQRNAATTTQSSDLWKLSLHLYVKTTFQLPGKLSSPPRFNSAGNKRVCESRVLEGAVARGR